MQTFLDFFLELLDTGENADFLTFFEQHILSSDVRLFGLF
jgi:hypothetical protein